MTPLPIWKKPTTTRLRFGQAIPQRVSINDGTLDELIAVKGLGPHLAEEIVNSRPWQSLDDLTQISGIGESLLQTLRPHITL